MLLFRLFQRGGDDDNNLANELEEGLSNEGEIVVVRLRENMPDFHLFGGLASGISDLYGGSDNKI